MDCWNIRKQVEGKTEPMFTPEDMQEPSQVVDFIKFVEEKYDTRSHLPYRYEEQRERAIGVCLDGQKQDLTFPENPSFGCELLGVIGSLGQTDMNFIF